MNDNPLIRTTRFSAGAWMFASTALVALGCSAGTAPDAGEGTGASATDGLHVDKAGRTFKDLCPDARRAAGQSRCYASRLISAAATSNALPDGLRGDEIAAAYGMPPTSRSGGAVVAIVDAFGDSTALSDVNVYRTRFGLGPLPACNGLPKTGDAACLDVVDQAGGKSLPPDEASWAGETALDLAMVSAGCPDCSIVLVEATTNNNHDLYAAVTYAASIPGVAFISNSWGQPERDNKGNSIDLAYNAALNHPGLLILASSGDQDYLDEGFWTAAPNFPASSPYVLSVGGTTLSRSLRAARGWSETVWNIGFVLQSNYQETVEGTGSGCSLFFSRPSFQAGVRTGQACTSGGRATNDVSAAADFTDPSGGANAGGILVYCTACNGGTPIWGQFRGTSASTPMVGAFLARLGLAKAVGQNLGFVYRNASAFNDIADGSGNDAIGGLCISPDNMCTATSGWDGPTGVGTPNGASLAALSP